MAELSNLNIVMVEDDEGHMTLIKKNLRRAGIENEILHFTNGQLALDYFNQKEESNNSPIVPFASTVLLLLDLNLPGINGFEVLEKVKSAPETKHIPVIVLSTTANPVEVDKSYTLGCNVYITKPVEYKNFVEIVQELGTFLSIIEMPAKQNRSNFMENKGC